MPFKNPITVAKALANISSNRFVLPAIQRAFVWNRDQICMLFDSLMQGYPIGSFLFWQIDKSNTHDYSLRRPPDEYRHRAVE